MSGKALLDHVSASADPRQAWKVAYSLPELLLVRRCGTLAGAQTFVEIDDSGSRKSPFSQGGCFPSRGASLRTARWWTC